MTEEKTIKIDGTEYKLSELSNEALIQVGNLQFTEAELQRANAMVAVMTTAKAVYQAELAKHIPKININ